MWTCHACIGIRVADDSRSFVRGCSLRDPQWDADRSARGRPALNGLPGSPAVGMHRATGGVDQWVGTRFVSRLCLAD
jgi:hypothetical protein